ncbi:MAG: DnaJ domain-containing protein [Algisphaera sp.]
MSASKSSKSQSARRKLPRHETEAVSCPLGQILDLSGSGMRIQIKGRCPVKVGQTVPIKLKTPSGSLPVTLRAIWRRRTGLLGGYQVGFTFVGIKPAQSVALATIARFGFVSAADVAPAPKKKSKGASTRSSAGSLEANIVMAEYYDRLDLPRTANLSDIKDAYRKLARKYHPDVAPGEENRQKFIALREAYDLLMDHVRRAG